jgi:hypothetical protein
MAVAVLMSARRSSGLSGTEAMQAERARMCSVAAAAGAREVFLRHAPHAQHCGASSKIPT